MSGVISTPFPRNTTIDRGDRELRTFQKYRMRTPSTGREVIVQAEPGKVYVDKDTGERLEVIAELLPLAPTASELPW